MRVQRLSWLGTRTEHFDETARFFREVLALPAVHDEPGFAMFRLPSGDNDYVEVFGPDSEDEAFYTTGPVVGFLVDDIEAARAELDAAGVELIGPIHKSVQFPGMGWFHFRGPDGYVYGVMQGSRAV